MLFKINKDMVKTLFSEIIISALSEIAVEIAVSQLRHCVYEILKLL